MDSHRIYCDMEQFALQQSLHGTDTGRMQQTEPVPARTALLKEAMQITAVDRNAQYGNPEDNFANIAAYWNTYLTTLPKQGNIIPLTSQDVAHLMILMKMARLNTNPSHRDSLVDIAGYAACGEDCRQKRVSEIHKVGP